MNVKPKFVYYDIRHKQSVCLIMYTHENDVDTQVLEVSMLDNGEPIELSADYTYSAAIVNRDTKALINDNISCELNDSENVLIPIDNFHTLGAQDLLIELTIKDSAGNQVLVTPFPLWIHVNASILDGAQVTPESQGTVPELLEEAKELVEGYHYELTDDDVERIAGEVDVSGKADKATTLAGYGITDGQQKIDSNNKLLSDLVDDANSTNKFVTSQEKTGWDSKYSKPNVGIPKSDLDSSVQDSLGKADTALQSYTEQYTGTVIGVTMNGNSLSPTDGVIDLGAVITAHQDISGKADKATTLAGYGITDGETTSHKVTTINSSASDTQYPSAKAVYDAIQNISPPKTDISSATVTLSASSFSYDGTSKAPSVTSVALNGTTLTEWTDYIVVAAPATNAGSYALTVNGIGDYTGAVTANWSIAKAQAVISGDSTITISENDSPVSKTYTSDSDGAFSFSISDNTVASISNNGGTVTVTPLTVSTATITVTLAEGTNYLGATKTVVLTVSQAVTYTVFGVCWDYSLSSPALTRLTPHTDPLGVVTNVPSTEPTACVGSTGGQSDFDNYMPWSGMVRKNYVNGEVVDFTSYSNGETYVYIPPFWSKIVDDTANSRMYFYIADSEVTGFTKHLGSDRYVGRYQCDANFESKPNGSPMVSTSLAGFRTGITAIDSSHFQYDFHCYNAIVLLYIVEFANLNSQSAIGAGITSGSAQNLGQTDTLAYHTGRVGGTDNLSAVQYRWIENIWGNLLNKVDGVLINNGTVYICNNPTQYSDTLNENYVSTGMITPTSLQAYLSGENAYNNQYLIPKSVGGSDSTYNCDMFLYFQGLKSIEVGGTYSNGAGAGLFYWNGTADTSLINENRSSRSILILGGDS